MLITFFAIFTQSATGFGLALISMPLLSAILGVQTAAPLVALIGIVAEAIMLVHYRHALQLGAIKRIVLASLLGIPIGIWILKQVDEEIVLPVLGLLVTGYAFYALLQPRMPALKNPRWADGLGFVAGVLSGAYNTPGPIMVLYGTAQRWPPATFKGNLQSFFLVNSTLVVIAHGLAGSFTSTVWQDFLYALPGIALGVIAGFSLDGRINAEQFQRIVLGLLAVIGLTMVF